MKLVRFGIEIIMNLSSVMKSHFNELPMVFMPILKIGRMILSIFLEKEDLEIRVFCQW